MLSTNKAVSFKKQISLLYPVRDITYTEGK